MSKAQVTRDRILQQAAELFNQQGYAGSSIADIMQATGLKKGGIYNHFESKQALALEAFDFAFQQISQHFRSALQDHRHAGDRLRAILAVFRRFVDDPPVAGGCLILNTAIESDDTNPELRQRTQQAMDAWRHLIRQVIRKGMTRGELRSTIDPDEAATILIATVEGAIMMSRLYGDPIHINRAIHHLTSYVRTQLEV
jgi:TetR/AcrR family transcriptional repressor of nem operon